MKTIEQQNIIKKIKLRKIILTDYKAITELQTYCFAGMKPWSETQFKNMLINFPEGQLCILYGKKIIASSCSLIINFDDYNESSP